VESYANYKQYHFGGRKGLRDAKNVMATKRYFQK
jgi:hypothetical protein